MFLCCPIIPIILYHMFFSSVVHCRCCICVYRVVHDVMSRSGCGTWASWVLHTTYRAPDQSHSNTLSKHKASTDINWQVQSSLSAYEQKKIYIWLNICMLLIQYCMLCTFQACMAYNGLQISARGLHPYITLRHLLVWLRTALMRLPKV